MVIGPTLQVQLPLGLAVEADALYRPLNLNLEQTTALPLSSAKVTLSNRVDTWEFPLLAKYRFAIPLLKPYVDTGPNFRAVASSPAKYMSGTGVTAGVGVEARLALLQIAPEVRYTHWGRDGAYTSPAHAVSYQNQIDFLAGFSVASGPAGVPAKLVNGGTKYVSFGVNGGMPFTTAFLNDSFGIVNTPAVGCITFGTACPTIESTVTYKRASRNYLVGALVEVHLPLHFSIEADGLYGPLSIAPPVAARTSILAGGPSIETLSSWSFPVVGKYQFHMPVASPYLEAGPTFRTVSSVPGQYVSKAGLTSGVGVESRVWRIAISPEVRFVHWGNDAPDAAPSYVSRRNQAQSLVGLSY